MSASGAKPLLPTFTGFVQNSMDGLMLFEACLQKKLHHLPRRPHDRERSQLIKSGNIFIYEEDTSGIKRWTDGIAWGPSRVLGNFLIYRELDKPLPPGEKKRAIKRKRNSLPDVDGFQYGNSVNQENAEMLKPIAPPEPPANPKIRSGLPSSEQEKELERSLIGSLIDSYGFRPNGLVKKTMSISVNGISHHLVSYYKVDDVKHNVLARPLQDPRLQHIFVRPELYLKQNFRAPIEETEHYAIDGQTYAHSQMLYTVDANWHNMGPGQHYSTGQYPGTYAPMATSNAGHAAMYSTMPGTQWAQQPTTTYAGHPSCTAASSYEGYYISGSQSKAKLAEPHATYAGECYGSSGTMLRSPFQSPVQGRSSTLGSVGAPTGRPAPRGDSAESFQSYQN
jgi:hypothetical protein